MLYRLTTPRRAAVLAGSIAIALQGCAGTNHAERGALVGTGLGALAGGIIGHQSGNDGLGAVLGGAAGMMTGAAIGSAEDAREERDWALQQAASANARRAAQPPLTNADLIYMAQNGLADEVIINSVRSRGGQFHLDPASLVQLKQNGVSDSVIVSIQSTAQAAPVVAGASPVVAPASRVVVVRPVEYVVAPPPSVGVGFHFGSDPHCHHRHHW